MHDPTPRIDLAGGASPTRVPRPAAIPEPDRHTIEIFVSGEWRRIDADVWGALRGPKPPPGFENNGCTASPDALDGVKLWPACVIHDWHYSGRVPGMTRWRADSTLRTNLWRCARAQGAGWFEAGWVSAVYWLAVRRAGSVAFNAPERVAA